MVSGGPPALTCSRQPSQFLDHSINERVNEVRDQQVQATPTQQKFRAESELERI